MATDDRTDLPPTTGTTDHGRHDAHEAPAHRDHDVDPRRAEADVHERRRERFGGMHLVVAFFGWLVAVGLAVILSGIVGAIATAVGNANDVTQTDLERQSGTIGIGAAIVLLVVLAISYFAGGYVAGRMARFDGGKQGIGVFLVGLLIMVVAAVVGAVFGTQYNVLDRIDVPDVPIPTDDLSIGGAITIVAALAVMLVFAVLGGKAGQRFHRKVDRTW